MQWRWDDHAKKQPALSPPITEDELRWWAVERQKHVKKVMLRFGLPMFLMGVASSAITTPEQLVFFVPFFAVFMFGLSWVAAKLRHTAYRQQDIRFKRIRESILADSDAQQP